MAATTTGHEIIFPQGFDARWEAEMTDKGYLDDVTVRFEDGSRFRVSFIDPDRLKQDLQRETESGSPYFAEPGLIVVPRVTRESIRRAVGGLAGEDFFKSLAPCNGWLDAQAPSK